MARGRGRMRIAAASSCGVHTDTDECEKPLVGLRILHPAMAGD
jgi:hypothetical protein